MLNTNHAHCLASKFIKRSGTVSFWFDLFFLPVLGGIFPSSTLWWSRGTIQRRTAGQMLVSFPRFTIFKITIWFVSILQDEAFFFKVWLWVYGFKYTCCVSTHFSYPYWYSNDPSLARGRLLNLAPEIIWCGSSRLWQLPYSPCPFPATDTKSAVSPRSHLGTRAT